MPYVPQRDLIGYGSTSPDPRWPGAARLAVNFVLNYEEGAESNVLDGEALEREHTRRCAETIERLTGERPIGWHTGRPSLNTRRLVVAEGGFLYDYDTYNGELPYWVAVDGQAHLVICHTLDINDSRFSRAQDLDLAEDWLTHMRDDVDASGEHWEVEFMNDGDIEIEIFKSDGQIFDFSIIEDLFEGDEDE